MNEPDLRWFAHCVGNFVRTDKSARGIDGTFRYRLLTTINVQPDPRRLLQSGLQCAFMHNILKGDVVLSVGSPNGENLCHPLIIYLKLVGMGRIRPFI